VDVSFQQQADQPVFKDAAEFYLAVAWLDEANCDAIEVIALSGISKLNQ
jgi:hypothetical protein